MIVHYYHHHHHLIIINVIIIIGTEIIIIYFHIIEVLLGSNPNSLMAHKILHDFFLILFLPPFSLHPTLQTNRIHVASKIPSYLSVPYHSTWYSWGVEHSCSLMSGHHVQASFSDARPLVRCHSFLFSRAFSFSCSHVCPTRERLLLWLSIFFLSQALWM